MDDQRASCPFCGVIRGDTPAEIVWRDDHAVAFLDRSPLFHGHTLVVPRRHAVTLLDLRPDELGDFFGTVQSVAAAMLDAIGVPGTFVR